MKLITLTIKGTLAQAHAAIYAHGLEPIGTGSVSRAANWSHVVVNGDLYADAVSDWLTEPRQSEPVGALLAYRWHESTDN